jgi:hypothetical protein
VPDPPPAVAVTGALAIVTLWSAEAARKFAVSAPLALTTHVPAPVELNVAPLTSVHGPLTRLYVSVELSVFVVVALTVKFPPPNVGVGAVPNVITGVALVTVMILFREKVTLLVPPQESLGYATK